MTKLNVNLCFKEAWRGFKGWWIPLCIVASIILFSQSWLPKWLLSDELSKLEPYREAYHEFRTELKENPLQAIEICQEYNYKNFEITFSPEIKSALLQLLKKGLIIVGILFLAVALLNIFMIIIAKASVQSNKKDITLKRDFSHSAYLALSYAMLAIIKIFPFFFCILPGVYLYVKLFYTGFIITEESANPLASIPKSWRMTQGNFFPILLIFGVNLAVLFLSLITIIGVIPGDSFNYTLRAASYKQLKDQKVSRFEG